MSVGFEQRRQSGEAQFEVVEPEQPRSLWRRIWMWMSTLFTGRTTAESEELAASEAPTSVEAGHRQARADWSELVLFGKPGPKLMSAFCRQFAAYLESGVTLVRALDSLRRQFRGTALGPLIGRLGLSVRRGSSLTDAFAADAGSYDRLFITTLRAAEARGAVPETLKMLSEHYTSRQRIMRQARSALIYPTIVLILVLALAALLTIFVLPQLVDILTDLMKHARHGRGIQLPWPTRALMSLSAFVRSSGWWMIPAALVAIVGVPMLIYRTTVGKAVLDHLALNLPVLGKILRTLDASRFARTLSTLLDAGIDIGSSLELSSDVISMSPLRNAVLRSREAVMSGGSLAASLAATRRFPNELVTVVESGEETGRLPEILIPLADDYDNQIEHFVKDIGNLLQPFVVLFLAGIVLFVVIAFILGYTSVLSGLSGAS
jgi:type II secretory pathway component PulF